MKKLLLLLFTGIVGIGNAQNVNIPDANFKAYLVGNTAINTNGDAEIQVSEAAAISGEIDCNGLNISDLTGIEAFSALTQLYCDENQLTNLDVTQNTALTWLDCRENQLTSLDVTQNTALTWLDCRENQLTSLDVSQNTALTQLYSTNNQLTSLDVTQNTALIFCSSSNNQLTNLDVTQNTALTYLYCGTNQLTSLDVSQNTALIRLRCEDNSLLCLNVKNGNNLSVIDFIASNNPNLTCIEVDDVAWSDANWTVAGNNIDAGASFSTACNNPCVVGVANADTPSLSIYPNPSNTGLIQLNTSIANSDINVYSIEGKQINFTKSNNVIDISDNEKGVYLISIDGIVTRYIYQE